MRVLVRILVAVALTLTLHACGHDPGPSRARATVEQFYTTYLSSYLSDPARGGLPMGAHLARLQPFMSSKLRDLITAALDYQGKYIQQHPDEPGPDGPPIVYKPPFVDGDHFTSSFEGYTSFRVLGVVAVPDGSWRVIVQFWYEKYGWQDVVTVTQEGRAYVIDDILFGGAGDFNPPGRLSNVLKWREK